MGIVSGLAAVGVFQSTRPVQGATGEGIPKNPEEYISIHAPRAGRDPRPGDSRCNRRDFNPRAPCRARRRSCITTSAQRYFNPRAPCRARLGDGQSVDMYALFQSTRPVQGATAPAPPVTRPEGPISIHAPRAGRDLHPHDAVFVSSQNFNPRAPCRARLGPGLENRDAGEISIHAPRAGRDGYSRQKPIWTQ